MQLFMHFQKTFLPDQNLPPAPTPHLSLSLQAKTFLPDPKRLSICLSDCLSFCLSLSKKYNIDQSTFYLFFVFLIC